MTAFGLKRQSLLIDDSQGLEVHKNGERQPECNIANAEMEGEKKIRDEHRNCRCLVLAALFLSTVSIILTVACGINIISMRQTIVEYDTKLKRLENREHPEYGSKISSPELRQNIHPSRAVKQEQMLKTGNTRSFEEYVLYQFY